MPVFKFDYFVLVNYSSSFLTVHLFLLLISLKYCRWPTIVTKLKDATAVFLLPDNNLKPLLRGVFHTQLINSWHHKFSYFLLLVRKILLDLVVIVVSLISLNFDFRVNLASTFRYGRTSGFLNQFKNNISIGIIILWGISLMTF